MLLYSFIVFKYVILILRIDKYILGRIDLYFWGFGKKLNYFRDLGSEGKYFYGDEDIICRETGRSMHYFQGSREHRSPLGGPQFLSVSLYLFNFALCLYACFFFLCSISYYDCMLVSLSLFNFVLCFYACFVFSVQFRVMFLCLFRSLCAILYYVFMLFFVLSVQFCILSLCLFHFLCSIS